MNKLKKAKGVGGQLTLYEDRVVISRKGGLAKLSHGLKGEKEILITSITTIQLKNPGAFTNGYIQFGILGGNESLGGIIEATKDENSVVFTKKHQDDFLFIKEKVFELKKTLDQSLTGVTIAEKSDAEKIAEFAGLRDQGIITEDEFQSKKKELLGP